jgi:phage host-nuclease inhibitor protein Gam
MKVLTITSLDALDAAVADVVRTRIRLTEATAALEARLAEIQKRAEPELAALREEIAVREAAIRDYCEAHRAELFADKKSRETNLAVYGYELTPPRVETASRRLKWSDVIERLKRLPWGQAYLRIPEPRLDKEALLADRERLNQEQLIAAGLRFAQDEQFFIRPKPETAQNATH